MKRSLIILIALFAAGCADFPEVDAALQNSPQLIAAPKIIPLGGIFDAAAANQGSVEAGADLAGRVAALEARAQALRGPVLSRAERRRLTNAMQSAPTR